MNIQEIIKIYTNSCTNHGIATESGDYKLANKSFDEIMDSYNTLKKMGDIGIRALENLLKHQNLFVQLWTSTHLLPFKEELVKRKLLNLKFETGLVSLNAEIILDEWENGQLQI